MSTIHTLSELPAELLALPHHKGDTRSIKEVLDQPLTITAAEPFGKTPESEGVKITAHLDGAPDQEFNVRVFSAQPRKVLAYAVEHELLPLATKFTKTGGRFILA